MAEHIYGESVKDFEIGERVELHPATDAWIQGDRFAEVTKIGRKYIHVKADRSGRVLQLVPGNLRKVKVEQMMAEITESVDERTEVGEFVFGENHYEPLPATEPYEASVQQHPDNRIRPGKAQVFSVYGMRISTRSSKPWKRKLAKKIIRRRNKAAGVK